MTSPDLARTLALRFLLSYPELQSSERFEIVAREIQDLVIFRQKGEVDVYNASLTGCRMSIRNKDKVYRPVIVIMGMNVMVRVGKVIVTGGSNNVQLLRSGLKCK
jgi:hypothetical protein